MKSKITIDVDYDNLPIIKIEHVPSDDVRDTLVQRFVHQFANSIGYAKFVFDGVTGKPEAYVSRIRPLSRCEMKEQMDVVKAWVGEDECKKVESSK